LQKSFQNEQNRLSQLSREIESTEAEKGVLIKRESSLKESEGKLKEFAQILKKQGKDLKQKEKDLHNAARLLSEKQNKINGDESKLMTDLREKLDEEKDRHSNLLEQYAIQEEELQIKEKALIELQSAQSQCHFNPSQQKIHELAMQLKEKDEQLSRDRIKLKEKLAKCDECEARLAAWQKELETFASTLAVRGMWLHQYHSIYLYII